MSGLWDLNLIRLFDFYLAAAFLLSTANRVRQYLDVLGLVGRFPSRWPSLLGLVGQQRAVFLTWTTLIPALLALLVLVIQTLASRLLWPQAGQPPFGLTLDRLWEHPLAIPFVAILGLAMLGFDVVGIVWVGQVDRREIEKYLDQAEYWLRSWAAPVVRTLTFGFFNPREMVAVEVHKALVGVSQMLNFTLWWVVVQTGLRILFGLSLWLTYALSKGN
jgi:hypothetical protein